jgi:hypothetical protein
MQQIIIENRTSQSIKRSQSTCLSAENKGGKTQLRPKANQVGNSNEDIRLEKEQEKAVAVIVTEGANVNKGSENLLDTKEMCDVQNKTLEDNRIKDVISGLG